MRINSVKGAKTTKQTELGSQNLNAMPIALPPIPEQEAIVQKVESLLEICQQLEIEIENSRTHADQLLQAVLKEAFLPAS